MGDQEAGTFFSSQALFRKSSKPKRASKLRTLARESEDIEEYGVQEVFKPKKKVASQEIDKGRIASPLLVNRKSSSIYTNDYLNQLREATPTTPKEIGPKESELDATFVEVDSEAAPATIVPDSETIRLAKLQRERKRGNDDDFIPLSDSKSLASHDTTDMGKRMQTEDDVDELGGDGNEGLLGYEDTTLPLGQRSAQSAEYTRRRVIAAQIDDREAVYGALNVGGKDEEEFQNASTDSDDEWERTQTKKLQGIHSSRDEEAHKQGTQAPELRPIPSIDLMLQRLANRLAAARQASEEKAALLQAIEREQIEVAEKEEEIKRRLQSASLQYDTARLKLGGSNVLGDM